jgi:hypothetical protein
MEQMLWTCGLDKKKQVVITDYTDSRIHKTFALISKVDRWLHNCPQQPTPLGTAS